MSSPKLALQSFIYRSQVFVLFRKFIRPIIVAIFTIGDVHIFVALQ